ncbi:MAG: glycerate kinase [Myxococcota bacterium]
MPCIVIAPDAFKESLSAPLAAQAIARGCRAAMPDAEVVLRPLSDGGEGFRELLSEALDLEERLVPASNVEGDPLAVPYGYSKTRSVLAVADIVGLSMVPRSRRRPLDLHTRGVGEALRALEGITDQILVGLGGSATVDGGLGALSALGCGAYDAAGLPVLRPGDLERAVKMERGEFGCPVVLAADVRSPLLGATGAARMFGPQKGASLEEVALLERGLAQWARVLQVPANVPGDGAAGGLGYGLRAGTSATLTPGIDLVCAETHFDEALADADLCITGEGRFDAQSLEGKVVDGVLRRAATAHHPVPVILLAGDVAPGWRDAVANAKRVLPPLWVDAITPAELPKATALRETAARLEAKAHDAVRALAEGRLRFGKN